MIYITGDTHGDFKRFSKKYLLRKGTNLTEEDYVIICGDFGLCWARDKEFEYHCRNFVQKKYTILWVQGNHENYDMIADFPIEEWNGGKVRHIVKDKVILLERGQIFEIEGKTFFTFGGAASRDITGGILNKSAADYLEQKKIAKKSNKPFRILHESWWPQELPDDAEMEEGKRNLEKCNYQVDYVITHCCATSIQDKVASCSGRQLEPNVLTEYFQELEEKMTYKHWYFGHYHEDKSVDEKHTLLYYATLPVEDDKCD